MADVVTGEPDVDRLLKIARRIEREGKKETAELIYTAASEIARLRQANDAGRFVDFVLRHTWPERATAHGFETVYSIIKHHPFAQEHGSTPAASAVSAPGDAG